MCQLTPCVRCSYEDRTYFVSESYVGIYCQFCGHRQIITTDFGRTYDWAVQQDLDSV